jgi:kinetochore protein Mis13/DSN1
MNTHVLCCALSKGIGLITIALPHSEVEVRDFYKYIEQSLPEPRRMKQLLTWCGSRALPEKPSGNVKNANAIMAARAIQQELIDDFASKPELSDWFSRVRQPMFKKPATSADNCTGRNCAAFQGQETEPPKREEQGHTARTGRRGQTVRANFREVTEQMLIWRQT